MLEDFHHGAFPSSIRTQTSNLTPRISSLPDSVPSAFRTLTNVLYAIDTINHQALNFYYTSSKSYALSFNSQAFFAP